MFVTAWRILAMRDLESDLPSPMSKVASPRPVHLPPQVLDWERALEFGAQLFIHYIDRLVFSVHLYFDRLHPFIHPLTVFMISLTLAGASNKRTHIISDAHLTLFVEEKKLQYSWRILFQTCSVFWIEIVFKILFLCCNTCEKVQNEAHS